MKCLIAGLGSIGRRHFCNLQALGVKEFVFYRTRLGSRDEQVGEFATESTLEAALAHGPNIAVISNPTALHMSTALACAQAGCDLFIEKPIGNSLEGCDVLQTVVRDRNLVAMVGFQYRFHPGLVQMKRLISDGAIGRVVSAQVHWGEYLGGWHPWEDYRQGYAARQDLGGGVMLTLCHPFDYLRWLIGDITTVSAELGHVGGLDIQVEDTTDAQLRFASGATAQVHLDYVQSPASHRLNIIGQQGTIQWDNTDGTCRCFRTALGSWQQFPPPAGFERNTMFLDEMHHFLACVTERKTPLCTLEDGIANLRIVLAGKKSAAKKKTIQL